MWFSRNVSWKLGRISGNDERTWCKHRDWRKEAAYTPFINSDSVTHMKRISLIRDECLSSIPLIIDKGNLERKKSAIFDPSFVSGENVERPWKIPIMPSHSLSSDFVECQMCKVADGLLSGQYLHLTNTPSQSTSPQPVEVPTAPGEVLRHPSPGRLSNKRLFRIDPTQIFQLCHSEASYRQPWFFSPTVSRRASPCPACKKSVNAGVGPVVFLNFFLATQKYVCRHFKLASLSTWESWLRPERHRRLLNDEKVKADQCRTIKASTPSPNRGHYHLWCHQGSAYACQSTNRHEVL